MIHSGVYALLLHQGFMCPLFDDPSLLKYNYLVSMDDGLQPVCDHQHRFAF